MQPDSRFVGLPHEFWANVRTISQKLGYTARRGRKGETTQAGQIKVPTLVEIRGALESLMLTASHLVDSDLQPTDLGRQIVDYFQYRADVLNRKVERLLMTAELAEAEFEKLRNSTGLSRVVPLNKQSQEKKKPAYFTGIVNMLIEAELAGLPCNYNPQELTTVTRNKAPFRTLARRVDGAFPSPVNPIAVWEIKEYYYTTTFGSRVADGVYETLLDGMELHELDEALRELTICEERPLHIRHLLMIDAHYTWWVKGRSYLCRIIDMLHMGYVDEVIFGREALKRIPQIVREWKKEYRRLRGST
jgi:hypothetical protein